MKAVVIHRHGGPEELVYEDIGTPAVGPEDVLINLETVGLNHFDLDVCDGISGYLNLDMPHILGVEGAGTVAETGAAVTAFRPGDRVMPFLTITSGLCRHRVCNCALGMDNICLDFEKLGVTCWGTYAEYVKVSHHNVLRIPDGVSVLDAAAGQVAFATAWELVVKKAQVRQGEDVLINAAGSGVGSAAIQCARVAGARIIATAGSDEKLAAPVSWAPTRSSTTTRRRRSATRCATSPMAAAWTFASRWWAARCCSRASTPSRSTGGLPPAGRTRARRSRST